MIPTNAGTRWRLNLIDTRWTLVAQAHAEGPLAVAARNDLFERYCGAAWRYLLAVTRNEDVAEELFQEFALRLIRGDFSRARPQRGRFRDYLKTVLINLVRDFHRARRDGPAPLPDSLADRQSAAQPHPAAASPDSEEAFIFLESWRNELLHCVWSALQERSPRLYAALKTHIELPETSACEKAEHLSRRLGESCTANHFRVTLHRARDRFAALLRREVAASLGQPTDDELTSEFRQLRLLRYCAAYPKRA